MQYFRAPARVAARSLGRARPGGQQAKVKGKDGAQISVSPIQEKLNGMYLKALESPKRPKPELDEEERERQKAVAKEYVKKLWWRQNEIAKDWDRKMELRMMAIAALPLESMKVGALMTPDDPSLPLDYRQATERPPAEGWHRPRVSRAAQDLAEADDFFKAQAALDSSVASTVDEGEVVEAMGESKELDEEYEKARRQKKGS